MTEETIDSDYIEVPPDNVCPSCCTWYDGIDYEYQICHSCGYDNNKSDE